MHRTAEREPGLFPNGKLGVMRHVVVNISLLHIPGEKHKSWPPKNFLPTAILVGSIVQHV